MMCTLNYKLSLGIGCIGNQDSCEDQFQVELTDSDIQHVKLAIATADKETPYFITIQEKLPKVHSLIARKLNVIAADYVTVASFENGYTEISLSDVMEEDIASGAFNPQTDPEYDGTDDSLFDVWEDWQYDQLNKMSLHDKAEYLRDRYKLKLDNDEFEMLEVRYFLSL